MSHEIKLIAIAALVMVLCAPGAAHAKDPPCQMVKGLCVRDDPEATPEAIAKKKKAEEEQKIRDSTPLVPIYSCGNGAPVTPDHQCRCPAGQVEGKTGQCAPVALPLKRCHKDRNGCTPVAQGQNPSTTADCPRGQVKTRNGLCRFAVVCPAGTTVTDVGKCKPTNILQGQNPLANCLRGQVMARNGLCVSGYRGGDDGMRYRGQVYGSAMAMRYGSRAYGSVPSVHGIIVVRGR